MNHPLIISGGLVQDFRLVPGPFARHVVNAPSPAATASLAIGREVIARILSRNFFRLPS